VESAALQALPWCSRMGRAMDAESLAPQPRSHDYLMI